MEKYSLQIKLPKKIAGDGEDSFQHLKKEISAWQLAPVRLAKPLDSITFETILVSFAISDNLVQL